MQQRESVNMPYLRSNSKYITSSKNFEPNIHRVVHSLDVGCGISTLKLCEVVGASVVKGGKVVHFLK